MTDQSHYRLPDTSQKPALHSGLEEKMATHHSLLAWRIPWTEERGGLQALVLTVAILNWGAFQTAENLCISRACRLLLFCKRRPTPDGVYVTASENAAAPAAALP